VVASHNHNARLGKDLLQLVDQIGFLRTIHANSKVRSEQAPIEVQQCLVTAEPGRNGRVRGVGIEALPTATHDRADDRSDKIPVPV